MPMLVCVKCKRQLRVEKNGVDAIEFTPIHTKEGNFLRLEPYRIFSSDKWKCPSCDFEVLAGFPSEPWAAEWMNWKVNTKPGVEKKIDFSGMVQSVINNPKLTHVNFTDFGREEQRTIEKLLTDKNTLVLLKVEGEENAGGPNTENSGYGSRRKGAE